MAAKKTLQFFFGPLLKKFFQDMGREPNNLEMILLRQKAGQQLKDSTKVIEFPQNKSFMKQVEDMKKSGDLVDVEDINISEKITDRDMFNNSFLNKPTIEGQMEKITGASNKIKQIQKEQADMYRPKSDAEIAAKYDKENKESIQRFKDKMKKDEPDDMATGGRAGFQQGGLPMVDPRMNLDYNTLVEQNVDKRLQDPTFLNNIQGVKPPLEKLYPVEPGKDEEFITQPGFPDRDGDGVDDRIKKSQPGSLEEYLSGYEKYKSTNPNTYMGTQALIPAMLPGGFKYTFNSGAHANHFNDYLESIGLSPYERGDLAAGNYVYEKIMPRDETNNKLNSLMPEDMAKGGRAGFYTGGITDVEPSLDDIGHGSDSLMARTRLVSPGSQATTSTGLNYLLAEDNDNIRVPFSAGGGGRRAFLKLMATIGGATAAAKSGLLSLGEGTTKKAITETVKQSAGSTYPPPYFYKLVEKIKFMGDDTLATKDKAIAKKYKDYVMEEDFAGNIEIIKKGDNVSEDVFMSLKVDEVPIKGKKGSRKVEEYEEYTARPDAEGKMKDIEQGVPDEVIDEAGDTTAMTLKKADGGRIGFAGGGGKFLLSKLGINSTTTRFLEKVFGKQKLQNLIENDPEMHRGLLEVAEMFRSKDKSGLVEYMQNFLPQMSKKELEAFVVGSGDTAGIEGQLIRLGSGRDYKNKIDMIEEANNLKKLKDFDVEDVSKNAEGGRIGFSGGGILRAIIANSAKKKGMSVTDFIKATNYKGLPSEVKMFLSAEDFAKLKSGQKEMYDNYIDMAKTRLNFQKEIEGGKNTPARELFEGMEKTMDEQSMVPKTVTSDDIAEIELMVKNRFNKGRKDNAEGGLQTMLGE